MGDKQYSAFVTVRKGFCYLTIKIGRHNFHLMRIRNCTLDAQDKRDMRQLYPDTAFDWKKIGRHGREAGSVQTLPLAAENLRHRPPAAHPRTAVRRL